VAAYYNEIAPFPAQWLRNLIDGNMITKGDVDERDIKKVEPEQLKGYEQCHFFAGIGVWSYALRQAGWPEGRQVWTGSCPCQPFSCAGDRKGTSDPRHLWPEWFRLIKACHPETIFGEQVASDDGLTWLDLVRLDLEDEGYAVLPFDLCAAGFGAPHIRQRFFFVAIPERSGCNGARIHISERESREALSMSAGPSTIGDTADTDRIGYARDNTLPQKKRGGSDEFSPRSGANELADSDGEQNDASNPSGFHAQSGCDSGIDVVANPERTERQQSNGTRTRGPGPSNRGPTNGFWAGAEWLPCRDGKARAIKPGIAPLVDGTPGRVGRLRAYGNAIVAPVAIGFIKAFLESERAVYPTTQR
jgi:DNA (cytosine-5)-methyltransferase 1